jgi:hypothetical protein
MPGPYVDAEEVKTQVNARLGNGSATVEPSHWDPICRKAIGRGYQKILNALVRRGYSVATIDQWGGRTQYNLDLAVAFAMLQRGTGNDDDRSALFKEIDALEKELKDDDLILVGDAGTVLPPDLASGVSIASDGRFDAFDATAEKVENW